jgi:hypothetical protein
MEIASMILGIIGLLISLTFFKDLSLILCVLAGVLGIISIVEKRKDINIAIAGVITAALGLIFCFSTVNDANLLRTGIVDDSGAGTKKVGVSVGEVQVEKVGLTKAGDLVVKITNNNEESICLTDVKANFKDANGNFVISKRIETAFMVIPGKSSVLTYFWGYGEDYSQYPNVSFQSELANISDWFANSGIVLASNDTGRQIAVTVKNNSGKQITDVSVVVIYYQDNEVVGAETGYTDSDALNGEETYINVDYPDDRNYNSVPFNKYEVYYVNASVKY